MNNVSIYGVIPPIITPFASNESIDEAILHKEVRFLFDSGVHGISFGGSTGEGAVLDDEELARGVAVIQEENRKKLPVLCGIIRNSTRQAISAGLVAKKAGADCLMITPTNYFGTSDEGNISYYSEIINAVGLPVIIYNVIASNPVSPLLMNRLCEINGIIGIKQSVGGVHAFADMVSICRQTSVFGAHDDLLLANYILGAAGTISAILSLFPRLCVDQWNAVLAGDIKKALDIHNRMLPVWRTIEGKSFPGKLKSALKLLGRDVGKARKPILEPSAGEIKMIEKALRKSGFIT